jgi:hypothetical protein
MLGVALFWYAYPTHWAGYGQNLTLPVTVVYFLGMTTSVWCLFVGVANFKRRNDPGGTITLEVLVGDGEAQTVEVSADDVGPDGTVDLGSSAGGSVGLFGGTPDTSVQTQTNTSAAGATDDGATVTSSNDGSGSTSGRSASQGGSTGYESGPGGADGSGGDPHLKGGDVATGGTASATPNTAAPTDGGVEDEGLRTPTGSGDGGHVLSADDHAKEVADRYCGNCEHFRYVRTDEGMQPYCGFHAEEMADMEACEEWSPNH